MIGAGGDYTGDVTSSSVQARVMIPWYSSFDSDFNYDFEASTPAGETFRLNVFLRERDRVFHTYSTAGRGVEDLGSNWTLLDLTPYGRQEEWEDSPEGWSQSSPYAWWKLHDEYGKQESG